MKKRLLIIFTLLCAVFGAQGATIEEIEISTKGQTMLGVGVGLPPFTKGATADMPSVSLFFNAGIASGFINGNLFGSNGAVDFGMNYSMCHYSDKLGLYDTYQEVKLFQHTVTMRSAFHFQFVKSLDVYAGVCGGVNICVEHYTEKTIYSEASSFQHWNEVNENVFDPVVGVYGGVRWYFANKVAVGFEFSKDFLKANDDGCEAAYGRSHFGTYSLPIVQVNLGFKLGK